MSGGINEINTYYGRCRCCLSYGYLKSMWEEHYWEGVKEIYVQMLVQCFCLDLEHTDDSVQSDRICETCIRKLRDAHNFKLTVLKSQMYILKKIDDDPDIKTEKPGSSLEFKYEIESEELVDEDLDNADYLDVDEEDIDSDDVNEMEYEDVEYLEDEDDEPLTELQSPKVERRKKQPLPPSDRKWPKKLPKSERYKTYKQYSEEDFRACMAAVRNEEMTPKEAAKKYNIPKKTIAAKLRMEPKDDQNGITTKEKDISSINKTEMKIRPTIFRENRLKSNYITKIIAKMKKKDTSTIKNNVIKSNINEEDKVETVESVVNIKIEKDNNTCVDVKAVRSKYKSIVNATFKKECKEPVNTEVNEMNKHKNNIRQILSCSNATMIKGFWGSGYSCCFCKIQKETPLELKAHNLETHYDVGDDVIKVKYVSDLVIRLDITGLLCKLCDKNINSLENLNEHLVKEHNKEIYNDIKNYIIPFKFDTDVLKCVKCNKEFKYFKLLSEHMSEHYSNYECPICERSFINKQSMQTHSYRHRNGVFKCSHCPKVFDTRPKRSVHERVTHTLLNKTRKCTYCDERFSTKDLVQSHESKVHGAKIPVFNCQACNKSYNSQSSLMTHRKRFHLMLRPHKCSYCDMAFFSRIELRSHTVTHTKARDFKCNMCNKSFGTRCSLNQHVRGHLDDRRFKCDNCERAFIHRTAFKVHMRSKHGKIV